MRRRYRVECDIRDPEAVARECRRLEEKLEALKAPRTARLPPSLLHPAFPRRFPGPCAGWAMASPFCSANSAFPVSVRLPRAWLPALDMLPKRRRLATESIARHLELSQATAESLARASFTHNARSFLESVLVPEFGLSHPCSTWSAGSAGASQTRRAPQRDNNGTSRGLGTVGQPAWGCIRPSAPDGRADV